MVAGIMEVRLYRNEFIIMLKADVIEMTPFPLFF